MNYAIKRSGLPQASRDFALEKISFSCGQILTGGCTFSIGKKDTPIHISRDGYIAKLRWITQKYVVLWDENEKRGWLLNGIGALLHLLRGSLEYSRTDKFKSTFLFDFAKFKDSQGLEHDSAVGVLLEHENRRLAIYPSKEEIHTKTTTKEDGTTETVTKMNTTFIRLENKVEELYECLEKMVEHKSQIENTNGINAKIRVRRHLEGWEFRDLATNRDPFYLHVATLPSKAFSWVELTRSIQAVTLFGRGFGELLAPATESGQTACSSWNTVPKENYYLCASVADLRDIIGEFGGDMSTNPIVIAPELIWQNPSRNSPFEQCPCTGQPEPSHYFPVQQIVPSKLQRALPSKGSLELDGCDHGAVIFGQWSCFQWIWPDSGHAGKISEIPTNLPKQDSSERPTEENSLDVSIASGSASSTDRRSPPSPLTSYTPGSSSSVPGSRRIPSGDTSSVGFGLRPLQARLTDSSTTLPTLGKTGSLRQDITSDQTIKGSRLRRAVRVIFGDSLKSPGSESETQQ